MGVIFNIEGLTKKFGGLVALDNVNFELNEGELKAVIGPNGAGKTTLFNIITGIYPPTSGKIYFMNEEITNLKPYEICRKGIARTYQITSLFQNLTVQENIRLAVQVGYGKHINFFKKALELKEVINKVEEILELMDLEDKANVAVSNMSHGDQRLLEVAIALGSNPKILLLDEPTAGMSIKETKDMTNKLKELFSTGKIVLHGVTMEVKKGEVVGLLGRNGVGKTTTLRSIMGLTPAKQGKIEFDGVDITHLKTYKIARLGIGYVPQGRRIFPLLTVLENLKTPIIKGKVEEKDINEIFEYFPRLKERINQRGGTLSGGEQQMLAVARALMGKPKLMILDEPSEGLQPSMVEMVKETIISLNKKGIDVLVVEQNLESALDVCQRIYVMEKGVIKYEEKKNTSFKESIKALFTKTFTISFL